jgi:serine/threonine protein kinase
VERKKKNEKKRIKKEKFSDDMKMVVRKGEKSENLEKFMKIGEGSTGTVCIDVDRKKGRKVEVKKMDLSKKKRREILFNEVVIMREYKKKNIVEMYESLIVQDEMWVVMELIEGGEIKEIVKNERMDEEKIEKV